MSQTVATLIHQWLDDLAQQGKSDYTIIAYRRGVHHFVRWSEQTYEEDFDVAAVLPRDFDHWKAYQLKTQKSAPATINQRLVAISSFLNWCVGTAVLAGNPARSARALRLETHQPRSMTEKQLNRLLRAVHQGGNGRDIAVIEVLAGTGIRVGELLALQIADLIDLDKRSAYLIVRQGKYGHYRTVPLTKTVRQAISHYLEHYRPSADPDAPLWMGRRGALTHSSSVLRLVDKYCIQARIDKVTPHQLRHTFATRYLQRNPDDLRGLAALLGHSDLNTVMRYTEPSRDDLAKRMARLHAGPAVEKGAPVAP